MGKNNIPKLFRKKFKINKWKKLLKHIYIPSDRKMVEGLFNLQNDRMVIKDEIPKDIVKKLKPLAKSIKQSKGMVTKWKGIILLVLAGSILIFTFFFKNMVIEKAMEMSLKKVFQADADVVTPRFSLFKGEFSFQGITVQDKDKPGKNLFETGPAVLSISTAELTRNRFRIKAMTLEAFKLNTARESDALEVSATAPKDSKPLVDLSDLTGLAEDPTEKIEALIEEQKENLKTLKFLEGAEQELNNFTNEWEKTFDVSRKEIEEFSKKYSEIGSRGIPRITSLDEGKALITEYEGYYKEIQGKKDEIVLLQKKFLDEKKKLLNYKSDIEGMIRDDLEYLKGLLTLPERSEMKNFVSDKIKNILMQRFQNYYDKAMKFMPYYEKFKDQQKSNEPAENKTKRMAGRTILFPSPDSPKFLVEKVMLSGGDDSSGFFDMDISGITSEPDKWSDPIRLSSHWNSASLDMDLQGTLDLKKEAQELYHIQFESPENPVSWREGIPALGVESAQAKLSYLGNSYPSPDKEGILISLDMDFTEIEVLLGKQNEIITRIMEETIQDINEFLVTSEILITNKGIKSIKVKSDLDNILKDRLGEILKDLPQQGLNELENILRDMISENLLQSDKLNKALEALNIDSLEQLRSLDDLESRIKEYESQAKGQADALLKEYEDKARAEAVKVKAEADRILAEAEQKKREAEAKAKAEADKKKKEAEAQAKAEAEKLKDSVKIPGF